MKRLGSPNFTKLPINAPKGCPVSNYQQDGHMQMANRPGRINYEPNGFGVGPREDPLVGYVSFKAPVEGRRVRMRPESFADHYSQARQFLISQTEIEQSHIAAALTFELGKCQSADIRERIVAHLLNIDDALASEVAAGLGMADLPPPAITAIPARTDLPPSDGLSILKSAVNTFEGRVLGVLVMDGFDADTLGELSAAALDVGASVQVVAIQAGGAVDATGGHCKADHALRGGKSVLFDAIAILGGGDGADGGLPLFPPLRDFLSDAHTHGKFIGHQNADSILAGTMFGPEDDGYFDLDQAGSVAGFIAKCAELRAWSRLAATPVEADFGR